MLGVFSALDTLAPRARGVIGLVPAAENMPGGRAFKPGGRRPTDRRCDRGDHQHRRRGAAGAGRRAGDSRAATSPTVVVDLATLTAAVSYRARLGWRPGCSPTTDALAAEAVRPPARAQGERLWRLPMWDEYAPELRDSDTADLVNSAGGPQGGAILGAVFLKRVRPRHARWAHLDIASTAWADEPKPYQPKGPTGVAVRTLIELARSSASWA